jgi:hypothetical protein
LPAMWACVAVVAVKCIEFPIDIIIHLTATAATTSKNIRSLGKFG